MSIFTSALRRSIFSLRTPSSIVLHRFASSITSPSSSNPPLPTLTATKAKAVMKYNMQLFNEPEMMYRSQLQSIKVSGVDFSLFLNFVIFITKNQSDPQVPITERCKYRSCRIDYPNLFFYYLGCHATLQGNRWSWS